MSDLFTNLQSLVTIAKTRQSKDVESLTKDALALGLSEVDIQGALALWRESMTAPDYLRDRGPLSQREPRVFPEPLSDLLCEKR